MQLLEAYIFFIVAVILSSIISVKLPKIPVAFIQILFGAFLFLIPITIHFEFSSEVFMLAVIAPLLFVEGSNIHREKLLQYMKPISLMAMALVFVTVIGAGFFLHWVWPELPMAAAFAIAAILCPTDAVAVKAMTKGKILPKGVMTILEGESLLNDAAGIISYKIAITALIVHTFSAVEAVEKFVVSTFLGLFIGLIIGILVVRLRIILQTKGLKDNNTLIYIQLLTPFVVYIVAELVHASGIIAVVIAGLIHGFERERLVRAQPEIQMSYGQIWSTVSYALNGFVFVILGYIVPNVMVEIIRNEPEKLLFLLGVTVMIAIAIYVCRFIWVYAFFNTFYYPKNTRFSFGNMSQPEPMNRLHYAFIMTMCGIHGTISVSLALTLPVYLSQQQRFEFRNDLIFIATMMVLMSLVIAQVVLPFITQSAVIEPNRGLTYIDAKIKILAEVIHRMKMTPEACTLKSFGPVVQEYYSEYMFLLRNQSHRKDAREFRRLSEIAREVEQETLSALVDEGKIDKQGLSQYRIIVDNSQQFKEADFIDKVKMTIKMMVLRYRARTGKLKKNIDIPALDKTLDQVYRRVSERLSKERNSHNMLEIGMINTSYFTRIHRQSRLKPKERQANEQMRRMKLYAVYTQREVLDEMVLNGEITEHDIAVRLREEISYNEILADK
ncbi:sodium:proton antiporter [Staphylococcus hyicus]|uniref:cation:proton antiporter n=1 Tax=Staphylococcus hyicus TaxID=1284 RepID=UPI00217EB82D|nr:sodium:proton antiporter [Staphylococcus hyicus]UWF57032.1 sodium:proton antiporter [Staphylococcus hyicus]